MGLAGDNSADAPAGSGPLRTPTHPPSHRTLVWMQERAPQGVARQGSSRKSTRTRERKKGAGTRNGWEFGGSAMVKVGCAGAREDEIEAVNPPSQCTLISSGGTVTRAEGAFQRQSLEVDWTAGVES